MNNVIGKGIRYAQGIIGLQNSDIILTSFPKSGNTWVRFFFCNLISLSEWNSKVVDFLTLDRMMPELGIDNLLKPWPYNSIPRIVKTHKNFMGFFKDKKSILVIRDPKDVMVSFYHFEMSKIKPRFRGSFSEFIQHPKFGLPAWFKHYQSWIEPASVLLTYEALQGDDVSEFQRLLKSLEIFINKEQIKLAAERSRFHKIQEIEKISGSPKANLFKDDYTFTHQGKSGNWKKAFSSEDINYFRTFVNQRVDLINLPLGYQKT